MGHIINSLQILKVCGTFSVFAWSRHLSVLNFISSQDAPASLLTAAKKKIANIGIFLKVCLSFVCFAIVLILSSWMYSPLTSYLKHNKYKIKKTWQFVLFVCLLLHEGRANIIFINFSRFCIGWRRWRGKPAREWRGMVSKNNYMLWALCKLGSLL